MPRPESLCDKCKHQVKLVEETTCGEDTWTYDYKRNGRCFNRRNFCSKTGQKLFNFNFKVKCSGFEDFEEK